MISLVILDGKTEELKALEGCFRNLVAKNSDEMLERSFFQNGKKLLAGLGNIDPVHMAVMDVTIPDGVEAAQQVRSLQPASEIMIVADMSVSPMQYSAQALSQLSSAPPTPIAIHGISCKTFSRYSATPAPMEPRIPIVHRATASPLTFRPI